jgi:hypothetical protein
LPLKLEAKLNVPATDNRAETSKNGELNSKVNSGSEAFIGYSRFFVANKGENGIGI